MPAAPDNAIRIRARLHDDGVTHVMALMPHPMETGLRRDDAGGFVAAHHIGDVRVELAGRLVLQARLSIGVSRDPLVSFRCRGAHPGDSVVVSWSDNRGQRRAGQATVTTAAPAAASLSSPRSSV